MTLYENEAQAIIDTAMVAAEPTRLSGDGMVWGYLAPDGAKVQIVEIADEIEKYQATPRRKKGTYQVHDAESLVAYLGKHGDPASEVWADVVGNKITAVINAHEANGPAWEDHRVFYQVKHTPAWLAWAKHDGQLLDQTQFAEHIEDRAIDIIEPSGATMLELAQSVQATTGGTFESTKRLSTGERQLEYRETIDAKAGTRGQLAIPEEFVLALVPFEGAAAFRVKARFRLRITNGQLRIGYKLERPEDLLREAFESVVSKVAESVTQPVFRGAR